MTLTKGYLIVCLTGLVFGLLGAALGHQVGTRVPDYYRTVFDVAENTNLPLLGTILGLTQGLAAGLCVGLVLTLAVTWYEINRLRFAALTPSHPSTH